MKKTVVLYTLVFATLIFIAGWFRTDPSEVHATNRFADPTGVVRLEYNDIINQGDETSQSGYIYLAYADDFGKCFLERTIYTPNEKVNYKKARVNPAMFMQLFGIVIEYKIKSRNGFHSPSTGEEGERVWSLVIDYATQERINCSGFETEPDGFGTGINVITTYLDSLL